MNASMSRAARLAGYTATLGLTGFATAEIQYSTTSTTYPGDEGFSFQMGDFTVDVFATSTIGGGVGGAYDNAWLHFQGANDFNTSFNGVLSAGQSVDMLSWNADQTLWYNLTYQGFGYDPTSGTYSWTSVISAYNALAVGEQGFVGVRFDMGDDDFIYGWIDVQRESYSSLTINGWGYDDSGAMINAGQIPTPGALGLLALAGGASGIRRKRTS